MGVSNLAALMYQVRETHARVSTDFKSPRTAPGALPHTDGATCLSSSSSNSGSIPADTYAGSATRGAVAGVTGGDNLDPEFTLVLEVRGFAGLSQCIQAVLRRTRGCGGESRQLKDHPRAGIQFRQREGHGRPFGGHLDLGTGSYVGARYVVLLAIAAENDRRLSRCSSASKSSSAASGNASARAASYRPSLTTARATSTTGRRACAATATAESTSSSAGAANIQAPNIALAHGSVPGWLDLTGSCVGCDAVVDAVIDENVGIGTTAERAVLLRITAVL